MDQARFDIYYKLQHRHKDGSWGEMSEDRSHHAPADHDPERGWALHRIFRCTSCDEAATLIPGEEASQPITR